jgi:hypothetical protein
MVMTDTPAAQTRLSNAAATAFVPCLTPNKIAILVLIEYFCRGQCPTAHSANLIIFLLESIEARKEPRAI